MLTITKEFKFSYGHRLNNKDKSNEWNKETFGLCNGIHGHNATLKVTVSSWKGEGYDEETGMIINFVDLKKIVNENIIDKLDHSNLNDLFDLPTCENIISWVVGILLKNLPNTVILQEIYLSETDSSYATWRRNLYIVEEKLIK